MDELQCDLVSPASYDVGDVLEFNITITAPVDGSYYVVGGLCDESMVLIPGTMFSLLQFGVGADIYAVNSDTYCSIWELEEDEEAVIPCQLQLDRTNETLFLTLVKMAGTEPSIAVDTEVLTVTASLEGAAAGGIAETINAFMPIVVLGMLAGLVATMVRK